MMMRALSMMVMGGVALGDGIPGMPSVMELQQQCAVRRHPLPDRCGDPLALRVADLHVSLVVSLRRSLRPCLRLARDSRCQARCLHRCPSSGSCRDATTTRVYGRDQ